MDIPARKEMLKKWFKGVVFFGRTLLKREYSHRALALLFLIALSLGAFFKSLVNDSLTMGYDDYRLTDDDRLLDVNALQKKLISQGGSLAVRDKAPLLQGKSCRPETE